MQNADLRIPGAAQRQPQHVNVLPREVRDLFSHLLPDVWPDQKTLSQKDSILGQAIYSYLSKSDRSRCAVKGFADYFGSDIRRVSDAIVLFKANNYTASSAENTAAAIPVSSTERRIPDHQRIQTAAAEHPAAPLEDYDPPPASDWVSWIPSLFSVPVQIYHDLRDIFMSSVFPEWQRRLWPCTFLDGDLKYPLANAEYIEAPEESIYVSDDPQIREQYLSKHGFVGLDISSALDTLLAEKPDLRNILQSISTERTKSAALFLDTVHFNETFFSMKKGESVMINEAISLNHDGHRFCENQRQLKAADHKGVNQLCEEIHRLLAPNMPASFQAYDEPFKVYLAEQAAALATLGEAPQQGFHADTQKEGLCVLVAHESDVKIVVLEGSVELLRRISSIS